MSTEILKSIFSLKLQSEDNESKYQEDIFDLPPLNNIDYMLYDRSFDHNINKITEYEDNKFSIIFDSSTTNITSPFHESISSLDIHNLSPSENLNYDKSDSELNTDLATKICTQLKKPLGRKRKSIPKIDKIHNINISQPIKKSSGGEDIITIGIYTKAQRREKIRRYREKKNNPAKKRILYQCRKKFADTRKRVKGRFVKINN